MKKVTREKKLVHPPVGEHAVELFDNRDDACVPISRDATWEREAHLNNNRFPSGTIACMNSQTNITET